MSDGLESHFLELKRRLIKSVIFFVVAFGDEGQQRTIARPREVVQQR